MRILLLFSLVLCLTSGCKKANPTGANPPAGTPGTPTGTNQPNVHAPTGVVTNPINATGGGGSGGAAQAVRKAVVRTVNQNELHNLRLYIDTASSANGTMPSAQEITAAIQKESPKTFKLVQDQSIILTGTKSRDGVWAYTADTQTVGGEHLVLTASGIERMTTQALQQRLR